MQAEAIAGSLSAPQPLETQAAPVPSPFSAIFAVLGLPLPEGAPAAGLTTSLNSAADGAGSSLALLDQLPQISSIPSAPANSTRGNQQEETDNSSKVSYAAETWVTALLAGAALGLQASVPTPPPPAASAQQPPAAPSARQATESPDGPAVARPVPALAPASVRLLVSQADPGGEMSTDGNDRSPAGPEEEKFLTDLQLMQLPDSAAVSPGRGAVAIPQPQPAHQFSASLPHSGAQPNAETGTLPATTQHPDPAPAHWSATTSQREPAASSAGADELQPARRTESPSENAVANFTGPDPHAPHAADAAKTSELPSASAIATEPPASHTATGSAHEAASAANISGSAIVEKLDSGPAPSPITTPPTHHVHLQIQSSVLGPLEMSASLRQRALEAVIATARADVHGTLSADLSTLQNRLTMSALHTAHVELVLQNGAGDFAGEPFSHGHSGGADPQSWRPSVPATTCADPSEESAAPEPVGEPTAPLAGGLRLSVRA